MRGMCSAFAAVVFTVMTVSPANAQSGREPNACVTCHSNASDPRLAAPAALFAGIDVHRERGFACVDCHGGDPTAADKEKAHGKASHASATPFAGKPTGQAIVAVCARVTATPS